MNAEETRHPNWIPVEPGDGAIRKGDLYRIERSGGSVYEFDASYDWEQKDFIPDATYYVWPRPEPKPYEAIPEGRENAAVMAVSVDGQMPVVGTYFREGANIYGIDPDRETFVVCDTSYILSAVPVTVVPTEALEALRAAWCTWLDTDATQGSVIHATAAFLAAIDGDNQ